MNTHIAINSCDRVNFSNTSPANCQIDLNKKISANCAELSYFMCPNTFYNITAANNSFLLDGAPISVDAGNYSLNQLITELLTLLPVGSNVLYNDVLNKMLITFAAAHTLDFSGSRFYLCLGYLPQAYPAGVSFLSSNPPKIYQTVIYAQTNMSNNIVNNKGFHSTFAIPITVNKGEMITFHNRTMFSSRPKVLGNELRNITFILKDEYDNVLQGAGDFTAIIAIAEQKFDPNN